MPQIVLWDLMDTLVRDPFFTHVPAFFGMTLEQLRQQKLGGHWPRFELDQVPEEQIFRQFFQDERPIDGPGLKRCMVEHCEWIEGMPELLDQLKAGGVEMHVLSNYSHWVNDYDTRLGISERVPLTFVSYRTGTRKPDPEAYLGAARSLGREPEEFLFVDDRRGNVAAAAAAGMTAVHFEQQPAALERQLRELGLLR